MKLKLFALAVLLGLGLVVFVSFGRSGWEMKASLPAMGDGNSPPTPAPELTEVSDWINSKPLKLTDQKGKVVVVHFWTNGCINCIHNYPHYRAWSEKYKDSKNWLMVGIHTPEFDAEKNVDQIKAKAKKNDLTFAIAVDNKQANWRAWRNQYWPCVYLVDKAGNVRYRWAGELGDEGYKKFTALIDELLVEPAPKGK
jgi:thiol-disulfide isomerase/thioredoxin